MEPKNNPSPHRFRPAPIIVALTIGVVLPIVGGLGYWFYQLAFTYTDSVVWYYEDFQINGTPYGADTLQAKDVLPQLIVVEATSTNETRDGRQVDLATITWDSAIAMSKEGPRPFEKHGQSVEMLDQDGEGSSQLIVSFVRTKYISLTAYGVTIHNSRNGMSLNLPSDGWKIERVFGEPKRKEKKRTYHNKWV